MGSDTVGMHFPLWVHKMPAQASRPAYPARPGACTPPPIVTREHSGYFRKGRVRRGELFGAPLACPPQSPEHPPLLSEVGVLQGLVGRDSLVGIIGHHGVQQGEALWGQTGCQ